MELYDLDALIRFAVLYLGGGGLALIITFIIIELVGGWISRGVAVLPAVCESRETFLVDSDL